MLTLAALFLLPVQLASVDISIALTEKGAVVEARFALRSAIDSLRLSLIHIPDQRLEPLELDDAPATGVNWQRRAGLTWITVPVPPASADGRAVIRLRYRLSGRVERIPLPVPEIAAEPGEGAVTLRVRGIEGPARLFDGFPRLVREADGSAVARLDNVPSFLRQPPRGGAWSVSRGSRWFVVLLVIGGSVAWATRARQRRRATARPAAGSS